MTLPTASQLARVIACPSSEAMPHVRTESKAARAGTARHAYMEVVGDLGAGAALLLVPEEFREECAAIDLEGLPIHMATEVTYAYNWLTGKARELGRNLGRDYSKATEHEVVGTIDVVDLETFAYIGDYKGRHYVEAKGNKQLLFAALCLQRVSGRRGPIETEIINLAGNIRRNSDRVGSLDIGAFESELKSALVRANAAKLMAGKGLPLKVAEGDHCRFCPAFQHCPAKTALLREMVPIPEFGLITEANATELYAKWEDMKSMMVKVSAAMYGYAAQHDIKLPDGRVFGKRAKKGNEKIHGETAYLVLKDILGAEAAEAAANMSVTKAGIKRAVKLNLAEGETIKAAEERVLGAIRKAGGASRKDGEVIDAH